MVVDSDGAYWQRSIVDKTILVALEHFGVPYRILDLAIDRFTPETLGGCAAILLAQNGLGQSLTDRRQQDIAEAVSTGVGLVNFDYDLRLYGGPLLEIFGFERVDQNPYATNQIRIREEPHYITAMQDPGESHRLEQMVSAVMVKRWGHDVDVLAHGILGKEQLIHSRHLVPGNAMEPGDYPILFAARRGKGRAVQFTVNLRIWLNNVFGHGREMDDLFWRAIVWAARKPFAANMLPPFVCMSVDDCNGRTDFRYAEVAAEHGFVSLPTVNIRNVPKRLLPKIRQLVQSGKALFNTHALDYYELLNFNFGKGECTPQELDARFALHDAFWKEVGVRPSETFRGHWGEYGVKALPYFKQRGILYFNPVLAMGLLKMEQPGAAGYWPYGLTNRMYDHLPDDAELFGFSSFPPRGREDFLTGCTALCGENPTNEIAKAARSAARAIKHGLRSGFFGELVTHEQKFDALGVDAWDRILARCGELTQDYEQIFADHDHIAHYLRSKHGTSIAEANTAGGSIRVRMVGRASTPLQLSVFHDDPSDVRREYREVEPLGEQTNVR